MAYHLSKEAQTAVKEFSIPADFGTQLFEYQEKAVQLAALNLNKRNGVLIGDVVGLGKTLMATALARIFQDDLGYETLIICPKNLTRMWQDHIDRYRLIAKVVSLSRTQDLADLKRYRLVLIDESHNLRNPEGTRYRAIREYIEANESRCILLSATPYNKTYLDLAAQLGLFLDRDADLGVRPEGVIRQMGETEFIRAHQCGLRTLQAFEKSDQADDWRELMRLYMVRRTRQFIKDNYAFSDESAQRKYLLMADGQRSYFPEREPKNATFVVNERDPNDPYARLYAQDVVDTIEALELPRYGLAGYLKSAGSQTPSQTESKILDDLSRAGKRLMGFCRTNLFKRLESGGPAFLQSLERHALRNFIVIHALEQGLEIPLGTQDAELLDAAVNDEDVEAADSEVVAESDISEATPAENIQDLPENEAAFRQRASGIYESYRTRGGRRFRWIRPVFFTDKLLKDLLSDSLALLRLLHTFGEWQPANDTKLNELDHHLRAHKGQKVLVFSQFADTVRYLGEQLEKRGLEKLLAVTGNSLDPTDAAWRFSPISNDKEDYASAQAASTS
jgi:SNF2 family DNA or RNA helicase